jgi:cysteine desulfurase/selenocysteine lyase
MHGLETRDDFDLAQGIWLNAAHQGPLPRPALEAGQRALAQKAVPWSICDDDFTAVPARLRIAIAELIGAEPSDIILGNSASYGLDVLAHGLEWNSGDEVLYVEGEFPASVFPWLAIAGRGVSINSFRAADGNIPSVYELRARLRPRTRVFICSWVNSFTGHTLEVDAVSRLCREAGVIFVLNASQALGARALCVRDMAIDAVTCCGYKWLLGPYATGFCWIDPQLRRRLVPTHTYWLPNVWGQTAGMKSYSLRADLGARAFDVFAPANFLNFVPWTAALEYIARIGTAYIERHNAELVSTLIGALDQSRYQLVSPDRGPRRSAIVVIRSCNANVTADQLKRELRSAGIYAATRNGALRLSPHFYNSRSQMEHTAMVLNTLGGAS